LQVTSLLATGTIFMVLLPLYREPAAAGAPA
jgi:hypothetical protein